MDLYARAKSIKTKSIWGIILFFTIIGSIVTFIFNIIVGIQILSTDWKNEELNSSKTMWGIFCFILLGPIAGIFFGCKAVNALESESVQVQ